MNTNKPIRPEMNLSSYLRKFHKSTEGIEIPSKFTFPFYYQPHPLVLMAAEQLQEDLETRELNHNFGLDDAKTGLVIGKMFGVLVVQDNEMNLGFLAAFSGKLADSNDHDGFVPPVYDMLTDVGYFKEGEIEIHQVTLEIESLEKSNALAQAKVDVHLAKSKAQEEIQGLKEKIKISKAKRKEQRQLAEKTMTEKDYANYQIALSKISVQEQFQLKDIKAHWEGTIAETEQQLNLLTTQIEQLKEKRKAMSANLQQRLFNDYTFLNAKLETKSLLSIFEEKDGLIPPAGSGECSAPKLLHFAYKNKLTPIAMGEFWWGASPKSEVRNHQQFYPACRGKCEPILGHMLKGLDVEENPMMKSPKHVEDLEIIYEDDFLLLVNKPAEFLSVPGKNVYDSVYTRMEARYPNATGPLLVHRLDMSTSGLLLVAKSKRVHQKLQAQFIKRTITKRYEALLDGLLEQESGVIDLPLRVDLENRPRQLVCYEYGKRAITKWEKIRELNGQTLVHFYPITGRTHQLRVHAAHVDGLNVPIVGDDLYGNPSNRLHLHAAYLKFEHPYTGKTIEFLLPSGF